MAKLSLKANPTFRAKVAVPVAGGEAVDVEFTFRHMTATALSEFRESLSDSSDADAVMKMVDGWDFAEEFNRESVEELIQNHIGIAGDIYRKYIEELIPAKTKN